MEGLPAQLSESFSQLSSGKSLGQLSSAVFFKICNSDFEYLISRIYISRSAVFFKICYSDFEYLISSLIAIRYKKFFRYSEFKIESENR